MTSKQIRLSPDLSLPLSVMGEASQIYGLRGSGKTTTAKLIVESLLELHEQCVILDPTNVWWGLKSSADGKSPGFPIYILGGEQGDRQVGPEDGEVVATWVVQSRASAVLSLRHMKKHAQKKFALDFLETMYHLKGKAEYQTPVLVVIDEASTFVPQRLPAATKGKEPVEARLVGAVEDIVRRGRSGGFGVCLVDQRPASVNKDVSTQAPLLIAHKLVGPQDRKALEAWTSEHGDTEQTKAFLTSLPTLHKPTKEEPWTEAWIWWPDEETIFKKIRPSQAKTYDSSKTPRPGDKRNTPTVAAKPDLGALDSALEKSKAEIRANDPKLLKSKIAELEKQLKQQPKPATAGHSDAAIAKAVKDATIALQRELTAKDATISKTVKSATDPLRSEIAVLRRGITSAAELMAKAGRILSDMAGIPTAPAFELPKVEVSAPAPQPERQAPVFTPTTPKPQPSQTGFKDVQQRILNALAWYESLGIYEPSMAQLGAIALVDTTGGYFSNIVGPLSTQGLVTRRPGRISLTDAGRALAEVPDSAPTLDSYHDVLRSRVIKMKSADRRTVDILNAVISRNGDPITTEEIGAAVGIDHTGGYFSNKIGPLSTLGLITRNRGTVSPTQILFPEDLL